MPSIQAYRHICQEARIVLTSLRGGPPHVARGDLTRDLVELRTCVADEMDDQPEIAAAGGEVYARPFLQVIMDPRAAGPHTLVTLRAVYRLLSAGSLQEFGVSNTDLCVSVLGCKFEQTDAGADEAVEMAIADVLSLLVKQKEKMLAETLLEAFNTVFVTRNTFVHSPALCYHFEDVLTAMTETVFTENKEARTCLLEFLVNQLLHTPLVGGDGLDESTREAQLAHDDARTLCLRLVRKALQVGWGGERDDGSPEELRLIQDELCLSLLMTGQAVWAYHDSTNSISPGFVSLEVLAEICATLSCLWNTVTLRNNLIAQFETILTGFYTRALVLLRKRKQPLNSGSFNANSVFDAEVEVILESLVDILCLHDHRCSISDGDGGSLETMFAYYDCHMRRSDVATGLFVELSRSCGGSVDSEGESIFLTPSMSRSSSLGGGADTVSAASGEGGVASHNERMVCVDHPWRQVPAHLKELCARALMGGMKCLFRDDNASEHTLLERSKRKRSIMLRQLENGGLIDDDMGRPGTHMLRDLKSKKRLMCKAARIFNKKASRGIEFLIDSGLVADPITPQSMATFLRNGIVVGLDKTAVGAYLGEAGKAPSAGKSPQVWERDWFHKDVLKIFCHLFRFEGQSLLDGLRMFLATFRLPGEAQQIDRILQAFSDSCSRVCEESSQGQLKIFSDDPKKASDAAYLLSFSLIMLNTDRHNANIREDRKMSVEDFVKNNTDYGRDIMEKGKEFPREFLIGMYQSINDEELRTEGEGADGAMTVERWKDVLRGSTEADDDTLPTLSDADDLSELVLEHVWKPIVSAIGALWGVTGSRNKYVESPRNLVESPKQGNMLGVQGARLGMDMSLEMLSGVCQLGRIDIFSRIYACICDYSGLLGDYTEGAEDRTWTYSQALECQAATVVAFQTALLSGENLDEDCWKRMWSMMFELRDLKLISRGNGDVARTLLRESDPDMLSEEARADWIICLERGDMEYKDRSANEAKGKTGLFSAFGRALFGSSENTYDNADNVADTLLEECTVHGKETHVVWDEAASSDDEAIAGGNEDPSTVQVNSMSQVAANPVSAGSQFESLLIRETMARNDEANMPVTGLERADETEKLQISARRRVRERLRSSCSLQTITSESRFMEDSSIETLMKSLVSLVLQSSCRTLPVLDVPTLPPTKPIERSPSDISMSTSSVTFLPWSTTLSPASEAFAEVIICELAMKNKDRLKLLWSNVLQDHYVGRLTSLLISPTDEEGSTKIPVDPGLEKRVTGLLRLSVVAVQREEVANEVLSAWKYLLPVNDEQHASSPLRALDRHIGEGVWRICAQVGNLTNLNHEGWEGVVALLSWCAKRGGALPPISSDGPSGLQEDDPALQCYRSLHLLLNAKELNEKLPCAILFSLRSLVVAGGKRNYCQLSIASLDLLDKLHEKMLIAVKSNETSTKPIISESFWPTCWRNIVEGIAEAAELSSDTNIRQHALSMLTDLFLHKQDTIIPVEHLCAVLSEVCVPLAGRRVLRLQIRDPSVTTGDQLMMEFELCIGLIFKPLRHHVNVLAKTTGTLKSVWIAVLSVLEDMLSDKRPDSPREQTQEFISENLVSTMKSLANEHLQNAIKVLFSTGLLSTDPKAPGEITTLTLESVSRMGVSEQDIQQWEKQSNTVEREG